MTISALVTIPTIGQVPTPPNSGMSEDEFNAKGDALLGNLPYLVDDLNDFAIGANALGNYIESIAATAAQSGNAERFVQGASYGVGDPVYSPLDSQTYRTKIAIGAAAHKHWCIDIADVWSGVGATSISLQYIQVRTSAGGSNIAPQATYTSSASPSAGSLNNLFNTTGNLFRMPGTSGKIYLHFATAVSLAEIVMASHATLYWDTESPRNFNLTCSDDNVTYEPFAYFTNQINWTGGQARTLTASAPGLLDPSQDSANWEKISGTTNADTVDTFHASQTPEAGQIPALKSNGDLALPAGATVPSGATFGNTTPASANALNWNEVATFQIGVTGLTTSPTPTIDFARTGNLVALNIPTITGISNATTFTFTGLPLSVRPSAQRVCLLRTQDAGSTTFNVGMAVISTNGVITLSKDVSGSAWTNTATSKAIQNTTIYYMI